MNRQTRRAFLGGLGAVVVAGCSSSSGPSGSTDNPDPSETPDGQTPSSTTPTTTPTPGSGSGTDTGTGTDGTTTTPGGGGSLDLPGEQVDDFESFDGWYVLSNQGELSAQTNDPYAGSQSAHVQSQSGDSFGAIYKAFTEPRDFSNANLSLAIKLTKPEIAKISVALLAPDRGNMVRMMRTMPGPTDRWVRVDFGTTTVERDPTLSSVQEIRIVGRHRDGADEPVEFAVDDLRAVEPPKKGRVMLTFDDCHETHYDRAFAAMQDYGFEGVEGIIAEAVDNRDRLDIGMMREMRDAGWDMASHPLTRGTLMPEFSERNQEQRITDNKEFLDRNGFRNGARHFLTPQNLVGPNTFDIVQEHHDSLFTFGGMPNGLTSTTNYNFGRVNATNLDAVKQHIDYAERFGQMVVLNHHAIAPDKIPEEQFKAELEYIDQAGVEVVTASDVVPQS